MTMSNAELRCHREFLGLSTQWLATRLDVGPRAVLRWESPGEKVPDRTADTMIALMNLARHEVDLIVSRLRKPEMPQEITVSSEMTWHSGDYPPTWHRAIAERAWRMVPSARIIYHEVGRVDAGQGTAKSTESP